jgi:hypothetical protein
MNFPSIIDYWLSSTSLLPVRYTCELAPPRNGLRYGLPLYPRIDVTQNDPANHALDFSAEEVFAFGTPQPGLAVKAAPTLEQKANHVSIRVPAAAEDTLPGQLVLQPPAPKAEVGAQGLMRNAKLVVRQVQAPAQKIEAGPEALKGDEPKVPPFIEPAQAAAAPETNKQSSLDLTAQVLAESPQPPPLPTPSPPRRELRTAAELAAMIEVDLQRHPQSPGKGLRVTVYGGADSWRAMLTITPGAGPVRDPHGLRDLTDQLAERLLHRYNLAWG